MVTGKKEKTMVVLWTTHEEFEYLMMGLHHFVEKNRVNAENFADETLGEVTEHGEKEAPAIHLVDDLFAPQHVDVSKMLDQMTAIFGYDPAVEG
jgi:hypothetical protein